MFHSSSRVAFVPCGQGPLAAATGAGHSRLEYGALHVWSPAVGLFGLGFG